MSWERLFTIRESNLVTGNNNYYYLFTLKPLRNEDLYV